MTTSTTVTHIDYAGQLHCVHIRLTLNEAGRALWFDAQAKHLTLSGKCNAKPKSVVSHLRRKFFKLFRSDYDHLN